MTNQIVQTVVEIVKHLPGQHDQDMHAGQKSSSNFNEGNYIDASKDSEKTINAKLDSVVRMCYKQTHGRREGPHGEVTPGTTTMSHCADAIQAMRGAGAPLSEVSKLSNHTQDYLAAIVTRKGSSEDRRRLWLKSLKNLGDYAREASSSTNSSVAEAAKELSRYVGVSARDKRELSELPLPLSRTNTVSGRNEAWQAAKQRLPGLNKLAKTHSDEVMRDAYHLARKQGVIKDMEDKLISAHGITRDVASSVLDETFKELDKA